MCIRFIGNGRLILPFVFSNVADDKIINNKIKKVRKKEYYLIRKIKNYRLGETTYSKYGSKMTIIEYNNCDDIVVEFDNGYKVKARYSQFKLKNIKSLYDKITYGVGFIGEGDYKIWINNKLTIQYVTWRDMLDRCYNEKRQSKFPTYIGCSVCDKWHNLQNFGKWFDDNYYEIINQQMALDKDILHKGNKIYSSENCVFVPSNINSLFVKSDALRGKYPIGVTFNKSKMEYESACCQNNKGRRKYLGKFNNPIEAFNTYKKFKEKVIKQIADEYKNRIPDKLYHAMYNYIVEITD